MQPEFDLTRYVLWAAIVAIGALLSAGDRRWIGWPLLGMLLVAGVVGGLVVTRASPFTFSGGDHFMEGVILAAGSALALAGYLLATVYQFARRHLGGRSRR
jgi:hypothetical protein